MAYGAVTNFGIRTEATNVILYQQKEQVAESQVDVRLVTATNIDMADAIADGNDDRAIGAFVFTGVFGGGPGELLNDRGRSAFVLGFDDGTSAVVLARMDRKFRRP